jgi:L-cysteine desulfidase
MIEKKSKKVIFLVDDSTDENIFLESKNIFSEEYKKVIIKYDHKNKVFLLDNKKIDFFDEFL